MLSAFECACVRVGGRTYQGERGGRIDQLEKIKISSHEGIGSRGVKVKRLQIESIMVVNKRKKDKSFYFFAFLLGTTKT